MVGHEAKGVDLKGVTLRHKVEDAVEAKTVLIVAEDVAAIIAAEHDVVNCTWNVDTLLSGHVKMIAGNAGTSNVESLTPLPRPNVESLTPLPRPFWPCEDDSRKRRNFKC